MRIPKEFRQDAGIALNGSLNISASDGNRKFLYRDKLKETLNYGVHQKPKNGQAVRAGPESYIRKKMNLKVAVMELRLYAPWVHSLKEKRMVVKSLLGKIRSRYAVSAAETAEQDIHQTIVIGVAAIVAHAAQADGLMDDILALVENSTEAEIVSVERELRQEKQICG